MSHARPRLSRLAFAVLALVAGIPALAQTAPAAAQAPDTPASAPGAQTLAPVVVRASADATAGGLKAPYAGGQVARGGRVGVLRQRRHDGHAVHHHQLHPEADPGPAGGEHRRRAAERPLGARRARLRHKTTTQLYMGARACRSIPTTCPTTVSTTCCRANTSRPSWSSASRCCAARAPSSTAPRPGGSGLGGAIDVMPKRAPNEPLTDVTVGVQSGSQGYAAADIARRFGPDQAAGVRPQRGGPRRRHFRPRREEPVGGDRPRLRLPRPRSCVSRPTSATRTIGSTTPSRA